jgi:hypothetical protein
LRYALNGTLRGHPPFERADSGWVDRGLIVSAVDIVREQLLQMSLQSIIASAALSPKRACITDQKGAASDFEDPLGFEIFENAARVASANPQHSCKLLMSHGQYVFTSPFYAGSNPSGGSLFN